MIAYEGHDEHEFRPLKAGRQDHSSERLPRSEEVLAEGKDRDDNYQLQPQNQLQCPGP